MIADRLRMVNAKLTAVKGPAYKGRLDKSTKGELLLAYKNQGGIEILVVEFPNEILIILGPLFLLGVGSARSNFSPDRKRFGAPRLQGNWKCFQVVWPVGWEIGVSEIIQSSCHIVYVRT